MEHDEDLEENNENDEENGNNMLLNLNIDILPTIVDQSVFFFFKKKNDIHLKKINILLSVFPRLEINYDPVNEIDYSYQEFQDTSNQNPHFPFETHEEKLVATFIEKSNISNNIGNELLQLLPELQAQNVSFKSVADIQKKLQDVPTEVQFLTLKKKNELI